MRTRTIARAAVAALVVMALLPLSAAAKPAHYRIPAGHIVQAVVRGTHGYVIAIQVLDGRAQLIAISQSGSRVSTVFYRQTEKRSHGDDLDADFGRAGRFKARFVPDKVEETGAPEGCVGRPTVAETGHFVGSFSFRGANGFTSFDAHRLQGAVTDFGALVCRGKNPLGRNPLGNEGHRARWVIAGTRSGATVFDAVTEPGEGVIQATGTYSVRSERTEGAVSILDSVSVAARSPLAIPDLGGTLPATTTIAPPAPFSGSATLEASSRQAATWSGDLAVDLPATGEVPLTGPGIAAGLCRDYTCTESLPKALRPQRPKSGLGIVVGELQTIR
jgi:hypothetical protein